MTDEPFGRQPKPVKIIFYGDERDVTHYMSRIKRIIEVESYDTVTITGRSLTIYPRAVND